VSVTVSPHTVCGHAISTNLDTGVAVDSNVRGGQATPDVEGPPVVSAPGGQVAHIQPPENGPPSWCNFLSVEDLDASTALAAAKGGVVLLPPTPLPAGRFSVVTTPSGAMFGLYEPIDADEMATPGHGSIHWVEVQSTSLEQDVAWFEAVFGFTTRLEQMAMGPYYILEVDGVARGGLMASQSGRSMVIAWVRVDNLDETLTLVQGQGGKVVSKIIDDPEVGRMAVVLDPSGAAFGVVQPA